MIILKPISTAQTFNFIGRYNIADKLILRDEQDNTEVTILATFGMNRYYLIASIIFNLKDGRHYNLTVYNGLNVCYRDRIFCTSQEVETYSINKDKFVQHKTNNDYITI